MANRLRNLMIELVLLSVIVFIVLFTPILLIQNTLEIQITLDLCFLAGFIYVTLLVAFWGHWKDVRRKVENEPVLSVEYDEKGMPSTYARELRIMGKDGQYTGVIMKFLMVLVRNGGGVARNCKAELRLTDWDKSAKAPSENSKPLPWADESYSLKKDIGARIGSEPLEVMFSSSQFADSPDDGIHALVSTKDSLHPEAPFIRPQDGFGVGDFKVEITITSEEGSLIKSTFSVHVDRDFRKLSMEKLS